MLASVPYPYPRGGFDEFLARAGREREQGGGVWALEREGEFIGCVGLSPQEEAPMSLGYWLKVEAWGRGYASEAAGAARAAAFENGEPALFARRFADNPASARVLEKLGFRETGTMQHWSQSRQARVTSVTYELRREHWAGSPRLLAGMEAGS